MVLRNAHLGLHCACNLSASVGFHFGFASVTDAQCFLCVYLLCQYACVLTFNMDLSLLGKGQLYAMDKVSAEKLMVRHCYHYLHKFINVFGCMF